MKAFVIRDLKNLLASLPPDWDDKEIIADFRSDDDPHIHLCGDNDVWITSCYEKDCKGSGT